MTKHAADSKKLGMLNIAARSHHHPKAVCIVCTVNAFAETFYYTLDNQQSIQETRPKPSHPQYSDNWSYSVLISATDSSLYYLARNLLITEPSEFEAFLSVARNILERLSKIQFIISHPEGIERASDDFKSTMADVTLLFECTDPSAAAKQMKAAKFLGRGISLTHIRKEKYQLLFSYLSRVEHTYNLDVLLAPKYDRFFVKAYLFVALTELYYEVLTQCTYLGKKATIPHGSALTSIEDFWASKDVTPETLIYCTTYYDADRSKLESQTLEHYLRALDNAFQFFENDAGNLVVPRFELK